MVAERDGQEILRVFVYGTLKAGGRLSGPVADSRISSKVGTVKGSMFNVGSFPAVVFDGKRKVVGEVHEYVNAQKCLQSMDRIEGYGGKISPYNLYNRIEVDIDVDGETVKCSTYEWNGDTTQLAEIENGVWEI